MRKNAASAVTSLENVPAGLDWQAFSAAYFPGRRRHDLEALTAYGAYSARESSTNGQLAKPPGWRKQSGPRRELEQSTPGKTRAVRRR